MFWTDSQGRHDVSIAAVISVDKTRARRVVPPTSDYKEVTREWQECEYRAVELADDSLGGLWEGEPGSVSFDAWPYTEFCVMIAGRVRITDSAGESREFVGGEAFIVPRGFQGTWTTVESSRKYFVAMR